MKFARVALLLLAALTLTLPAAAARTGAPRADLAPLPGEVIVQFKAEAGVLRKYTLAARSPAAAVSSALAGRAQALGGRVGRTLQAGPAVGERTQLMRAAGVSAQALAAQLAADPDVEFAVPNGRQRILTAPNDPLYPATAPGVRLRGPDSGQWYLRSPDATVKSSIAIETAWLRTTGSASVVVAVLDTGVRPDHPDLNGRLLAGYDFVSEVAVANDGSGRDADPSDPGDWTTAAENNNSSGDFYECGPFNPATGLYEATPSSWHGTQTASLAGASTDNGVGMAGTAPGVKLLPVRVLGKCYGYDSDIQAGLRWAAGIAVPGVPDNPNPAKVLNLSLGGSGSCSAAYQSVVNEILAKGAVVVAAAGNSAGGPVGTPANCAGVVSVLALRHVGTKVGFSDLGPEIAIAAPGGNCINIEPGSPCLYPILAATNTGTLGPAASSWTDSYNISVGTSFSAPLVAGTVGLMFSAQPTLTPAQVRSQLQATATPFPTTGGDNGDGSVVPVCVAPVTGVEQLQCYCTTGTCGAGMLNAGAAVAAVAGATARIDLGTPSPTAGSAVALSGAASLAGAGATVTGYDWSLSDGGGIVSAFTTATNAATASLTPSAAGSFTVKLTVTDSLGHSSIATQVVTVAAAPVDPPPPAATGGSGGGAFSAGWMALLAGAVAALRHPRRKAAPRRSQRRRPG
ncbi:MAG: S8 family peptidase [Rubrivivax sp.]|nr:S8 family peptidase [Rubrivivax sp.]